MISRRTSPIDYFLLNETIADPDSVKKSIRVLNEDAFPTPGGKKLYTISYEILGSEFGRRNWNGRNYVDEIFMPALDKNPLIQRDLKGNGNGHSAWGSEMGHPIIEKGQNELQRQMTIDPTRVCATIDRYWKTGNRLMLQCTTAAGGWGDVLRDRILTGLPAMVSSRAIGGVDKAGNVLPGLTIVTFDHVFRPSSQDAYMTQGSERINSFQVPAGNAMTESAVRLVPGDDSLKSFLLSETASRDRISLICDTMRLDYDAMAIRENALVIERLDENGCTTLEMPLRSLVDVEYQNLFL